MRRAIHVLSALTCAVSLLVATAAAAMWVRSWWVGDLLSGLMMDDTRQTNWRVDALSVNGALVLSSDRTVWFTPSAYAADKWYNPHRLPGWKLLTFPASSKPWPRLGKSWYFLGLQYRQMANSSPSSERIHRDLLVPYWMIVAAGLVLPALWLRAARRRALSRRPGLCPSCGYDLRASPGRCPECGAERPAWARH